MPSIQSLTPNDQELFATDAAWLHVHGRYATIEKQMTDNAGNAGPARYAELRLAHKELGKQPIARSPRPNLRRRGRFNAEFGWSADSILRVRHTKIEVAIVQATGRESLDDEICTKCRDHNGFWDRCVRPDATPGGTVQLLSLLYPRACANCVYSYKPNDCKCVCTPPRPPVETSDTSRSVEADSASPPAASTPSDGPVAHQDNITYQLLAPPREPASNSSAQPDDQKDRHETKVCSVKLRLVASLTFSLHLGISFPRTYKIKSQVPFMPRTYLRSEVATGQWPRRGCLKLSHITFPLSVRPRFTSCPSLSIQIISQTTMLSKVQTLLANLLTCHHASPELY